MDANRTDTGSFKETGQSLAWGGSGPPPTIAPPAITMPKGGGAVRGIGEKFTANPVTGIGTFSIPIPTSPARGGASPALALTWQSTTGDGDFGIGWQLAVGAVTRQTDRGLPRYADGADSDVFVLSGVDDLVRVLDETGEPLADNHDINGFSIRRYRPRVEGGFARIERWTEQHTQDVHWRVLSSNNVLAVYGRDPSSRVRDPSNPARVFGWLLCQSRDDVGNAILYEYKADDATGVDLTQAHERARGDAGSPVRAANQHLKRVRYGNQTPLLDPAGRRPVDLTAGEIAAAGFMFEIVLDYGEHDAANPMPGEGLPWLCRNDPFSTYRQGFEVRNYRLCRRFLLFHHFPEEAGVGADCLVRSLDLDYRSGLTITVLESVTECGYQRDGDGGYLRRALPPTVFGYTVPTVSSEIRTLDQGSLENLPSGVDGLMYQWVDLDGEGLAGALSEAEGELFYKPNLGGGRLGEARSVTRPETGSGTLPGARRLLDIGGDGRLAFTRFDAPAGFFRRNPDLGWDDFQPFTAVPSLDWSSTNIELIDLTGDGLADVLATQDSGFRWHPSLADAGFGPEVLVTPPLDEDSGPRLVLADGTQTIFLADMSGDGLTDLVRIRNGDIRYWPNLGYGRFGSAVVMDEAPVFDQPDRFDPRRVRLTDIDGSGTIDVIYLRADSVIYSFNRSGNGWGPIQQLVDFPVCDNSAAVQAADLLGNGTGCLVWSTPLPSEAGQQLRYIDLMGGIKPHLLESVINNSGGETRLRYAASTSSYLADQAAGKPWITRLPFPVYVVEQVEQLDHVSRTRFTTRFSYHHGCFDNIEREFRGFGRVDQIDTEEFDAYSGGAGAGQSTEPELFQPPVTTRTWYHTGVFVAGHSILHPLRSEYFDSGEALADPPFPSGLDEGEFREAVRALKGAPLRSEVYSDDASPLANIPYSVTEKSLAVRVLQRRNGQRHAVFHGMTVEDLGQHYERNLTDPRVEHALAIEIGPYGNPVKSASVCYGRRTADAELPAEVTADQQRIRVAYVEHDYTEDIDEQVPVPTYRLRTTFETQQFDVTGVEPGHVVFTVAELTAAIADSVTIAFEDAATDGFGQRRLTARSVTTFRNDALDPLPAGQWDTRGLPYQQLRLAITAGQVAHAFGGEVSDGELTTAGYMHLDGDTDWWVAGGTDIYPDRPEQHFFRPVGMQDPTGLQTVATYDRYELLVKQVRVPQAPWNVVSALNDYRVLTSVQVTDSNGNRSAVLHDALGLVVASAVMGKEGAGDGNTLEDPTVRTEYNLSNWMTGQPNYVHTYARETFDAGGRWQESLAYLAGNGAVAMTKSQAPPGKAFQVNPDGIVSEVDADPRWIGSGRAVLNNKGNPVKQYEPFFSTTSDYDSDEALRSIGVTPIMYYDPLGRLVRVVAADGTETSTTFDPWSQSVADPNDSVLTSAWYVERGSPDPLTEAEPVDDPSRRAAWLTAQHADTPAVTHLDNLGRPVYSVANYGGGKTSSVRTAMDTVGCHTTIYDQANRHVAEVTSSMLGVPIVSSSAERGSRWALVDATGKLMRTWDEFGRRMRFEYDSLHRVVGCYGQDVGQGHEQLVTFVVFGDQRTDAQALNLLGRAHQMFDSAGKIEVASFDFTGNPSSVHRALALNYRELPDWTPLAAAADYPGVQATASALLDTEVFSVSADVDALGRPLRSVLADGTVLIPTYDEASQVASLSAQLTGGGVTVNYLIEQTYNAKGQRLSASHGNGLSLKCGYDAQSFRLTNLKAFPTGSNPASAGIQNLQYTYDAVGNIVQIEDTAQQTRFFANAVVPPQSLYRYDAIYQLVKAAGREHAGGGNDTTRTDQDLEFVPQLPHVNDVAAVRNYTETYEYDLLGNLLTMQHSAPVGNGGWTRHYTYGYQNDPGDRSNRLLTTSRPGDPDGGPYTQTYDYDSYGNMSRLRLPTPGEFSWNLLDQLQRVDLGGGGRAFYTYGVGGQRVRKVLERPGGRRLERIYLGGVEIYRERQDDAPKDLERHTIRISDGYGPVAQIDVKTLDNGNRDPNNPLDEPLVRYQYSNQLGSAIVETDDKGAVISYEEYHPFGTSAYRSAKPGADLSLKRYRFAGQERDDETGLYYVGARYYAPWLGRWTSADPAGFVGGLNLYRYCSNSPSTRHDPGGCQDVPISQIGTTAPHGRQDREEADQVRRGEGTPQEALGYFQSHGNSQLTTAPTWSAEHHEWLFTDTTAVTPSNGEHEGGAGTSTGGTIIRNNPPGHTIAVPESLDDAKLARLQEGVRQRTVARNTGPVNKTSTRRNSPEQRRAAADFKSRTALTSTEAAGHRIDMMYDGSGRVGQSRFDFIREDRATNSLDGSQGMGLLRSQPQGVPAGGVARSSEAANFRNTPHFRTGMRAFGGTIAAAGTALAAYALYRDFVEGEVTMGVGDFLGVAGGGLELYALGASAFGSGASAVGGVTIAGFAALPLGIALGGVSLAVTSAVNGYRSYRGGDTLGSIAGGVGFVGGTALAVGGGIALASAAGLVMLPVFLAAAPVLIAVGAALAVAVGIFYAGRHFGVWLP